MTQVFVRSASSAQSNSARTVILSLTFLMVLPAALAYDQAENEIAVATSEGKGIVVHKPHGACSLDDPNVLRQIGADASFGGIPALVTYPMGASKNSRVMIVDRKCNVTQNFAPYGILIDGWAPKLAEASRLDFLDLSDQRRGGGDPAWGS